MTTKRYYWLKLNEGFFEDDTMRYLEEQENGKDYIIFYLKLCLKSLSDEGILVRYVGEKLIPYDVPALARLTDTKSDTVAVAMKLFLDIGLIQRYDTGEIYINQINEMIGTETDSAKRMRKKRLLEHQKQLPSQSAHNVQRSDTEIDIDIELEKEIDIEKDKPSKADALNEEFDKWWELYGKRGNRKPALQKFKTCRKKHSFDQIINGTKEYLKTVTDKKFQKHGSTFLNAEGYMDDYTQDANYNIGASNEVSSMEEELGLKTEPTREFTQEEIEEFNREELQF